MFIGMDIGSSSVKAVAMMDGKHYKAKAEYPAGTSALEQNALAVAETVAECFRRLLSQNDLPAARIRGIGLCGHGPSIVFVDERGAAKSTIITWQDHRAAPQAARLRDLIPGFTKDGTSFEAKLLWSWENQREFFEAGYTALYPKDYLLGLLCGRVCMDESTASAITYYDRKSLSWDTLDLFPKENLPEVVAPWKAAGETGTEFSRSCGLPDGIAVYPGGIDCFCEAVGAGGVAPGLVVDGTGTSTCLTRVAARGEGASYHVLPNMDLSVNMLSSTGASFKWFCEKIDPKGTEIIDTLDPAKPTKLLFLPYLNGERCPIWDEKATGLFLGLTAETDRREMLQAVLQGVAFAIRHNLEDMGGADAVGAVGGGNRSDTWLQIKADVCGVPFRKLSEQDASAFGSALLAAIGSGSVTNAEGGAMVDAEKVFTPNEELRAFYDELYSLYKEAYLSLKGIMHRMSSL